MCFCVTVPDGHRNYILQWITGLEGQHLHASTYTIYALRIRKGYKKETKVKFGEKKYKPLTGSILVFLWVSIVLHINGKLPDCQNIFTFFS